MIVASKIQPALGIFEKEPLEFASLVFTLCDRMAPASSSRPVHRRDRPMAVVNQAAASSSDSVTWLEPSLKLALLLAVTLLLGSSGLRLLQSASTRVDRLQELDAELQLTESRVQVLKNDFARVFSTSEARTVMQEQGNWIQPGQKRIVWQEEGSIDR